MGPAVGETSFAAAFSSRMPGSVRAGFDAYLQRLKADLSLTSLKDQWFCFFFAPLTLATACAFAAAALYNTQLKASYTTE